MKKLVIVMLAGVGLIAFARRAAGHGKRQDQRILAPVIPSASGRSIDPGIVVHSPFNGDPGIAVHSPFNGDPGIVRGPTGTARGNAAPPQSTPASQSDRPPAHRHDLV